MYERRKRNAESDLALAVASMPKYSITWTLCSDYGKGG